MEKLNVSEVAKGIRIGVIKHQPEILTGIGIAGMITTTVMAVKATPRALDIMAEVKKIHDEDIDRKAFAKDVLTKVAPAYIPTVIIGSLSIACLIGASSVNLRRNAALATAYTLSESALKDYRSKVIETLGEKKDQAVRDAVAKDKIEDDPVSKKEIIITGGGDTLCYDLMCKRYFKSNIEKLKKVENELNRRMRSENYISLNEFYNEVGLDDVGIGYEFGWNIDRGYIELEFSCQLTDDGNGNEIPCIVVGFRNAPDYNYR